MKDGPNQHPKLRALFAATLATAVLGLAACGGDDEATADAASTTSDSASISSTTSETTAAPSTIPQPSQAMLAAASLDELPVADESKRLDITAPVFSNPTEISNPLFPISELESVVFSGKVDGKDFHTETTLLPQTRIIEWSPGQQVEALVSQYAAFEDGRIEEVALDYYAQADDGAVWYLGEDVFDYDPDGLVDSTEGTWLAGKEGPPEMIMPADPQVGDVHRPENIPGIAFEEVEIKAIDETLDGPAGPVEGGMVARELHDDGTYSDKIFAPGYGEFFSGHGTEVEAMALAIPIDAIDGPAPAQLESLSAGAHDLLDAIEAGDWKSAAELEQAVSRTWQDYPGDQVPPRIGTEMERALSALDAAISSRDETAAATAAIDVAQSALDLELRYGTPAEIDLARFELWAAQVVTDATAGDVGGVRSSVSTMEWTRDRFAETIDPADLVAIDTHMTVLRDTVAFGNEDLKTAAAEGRQLQQALALKPVPAGD